VVSAYRFNMETKIASEEEVSGAKLNVEPIPTVTVIRTDPTVDVDIDSVKVDELCRWLCNHRASCRHYLCVGRCPFEICHQTIMLFPANAIASRVTEIRARH
jgi:hypothetical protein